MLGNKLKQTKITLRQKIILLILSLFFFLAILEIGLRLGSFIFLSLQELRNISSIKQKGSFKIMCFGESTPALGGIYSYPYQLEDVLAEHRKDIKFSVINKGVPATNTSFILLNLENNLDKHKPDMVIVMAGINDLRLKYLGYAETYNTLPAFFKSLKIRRLFKLIWLHITMKVEEFVFLTSDKIKMYVDKFKKFYAETTNHSLIQEILKNTLRVNHKENITYIELGNSYMEQGRYAKAEEAFGKVKEFSVNNASTYTTLATMLTDGKKYKKAEEYFKKAEESSLGNSMYSPLTINNYREIKEILDRRSIKLVCVQYPMRSIEPLKRIFKDGVSAIFVDNEVLFKEVVKKEGYREYFIDMFAGDFGHCTPKGNRLLAENVANAILKEYFKDY